MKIRVLFLAAMLCALCVGQASALEYTMEAPDDYLFARPTSDETIYEWENPNVDRSKNTALIPPTFGSPTSYLPGSGTPLTPNLVPGALDGGLVTQMGPIHVGGETSGDTSQNTVIRVTHQAFLGCLGMSLLLLCPVIILVVGAFLFVLENLFRLTHPFDHFLYLLDRDDLVA